MHLSMSSRQVGEGRRGVGQGFDQLLWPRGRAFEYLVVLEVGIFKFLFVPVTTNHFPEWGISVKFDLTFLPGGREFYSDCLGKIMSIPRPMSCLPPPPPFPAGLTLMGTLRRAVEYF